MWTDFIVASLVFIALFLILIAFLAYNYRQAGERAIVLPVSIRRLQSVGLGNCLIVVGSYVASLDTTLYSVIGGVLSGSGSFLWLQFFCPIEFRQHGIIFSGTLVRWSHIQSYRWQNSQYLLLIVKYWGWQSKHRIKVSLPQQASIEYILQERIANSRTTL